jgi:hypothetical protein
MRHPDFYVLPCAATYFHSNQYHKDRPWIKHPADWKWEEHGKRELLEAKLNPLVPDFAEVLALELIARVYHKTKKDIHKINVQDVLHYWCNSKVDSHMVLEGHLPTRVPVQYIEAVVMPQAVHDSLTADERTMVAWFKKLHVEKDDNAAQSKADELTSETTRYSFLKGLFFLLEPVVPLHGTETNMPYRCANSDGIMHIYFKAQGTRYANNSNLLLNVN